MLNVSLIFVQNSVCMTSNSFVHSPYRIKIEIEISGMGFSRLRETQILRFKFSLLSSTPFLSLFLQTFLHTYNHKKNRHKKNTFTSPYTQTLTHTHTNTYTHKGGGLENNYLINSPLLSNSAYSVPICKI